MEHIDFINLLREALKPLPGFVENNSHFMVHCPNCETTRDKNKHGHLYLNKLKSGVPLDCKKCDLASRVLTPDILRKIGVQDLEVSKFVNDNHKVHHTHIVNLDERNKRLDYQVETKLTKQDKLKLAVLNDRLNHDFANDEDIKTYKIVVNLSSFMKKNNIDPETLKEHERANIEVIDKNYIGFLSYYGNIISFRKVTETKLPRYVTFTLSNDIKRSYMYVPAIPIDPLTEDPKIIVAEGAIDIISIRLNNMVYDSNNAMYISSSSVGAFRRAIKNALSISGFFGATISLYLDNEDLVTKIEAYDFSKIVSTLHGFGKDFRVIAYVNLAGKDFGNVNEGVTIGKMDLTSRLK